MIFITNNKNDCINPNLGGLRDNDLFYLDTLLFDIKSSFDIKMLKSQCPPMTSDPVPNGRDNQNSPKTRLFSAKNEATQR